MVTTVHERLGIALLLAALAAVPGCGSTEPGPDLAEPSRPAGSPNARLENVAVLRQDLDAPRHAADGGGAAWIESSMPEAGPVTAGTPGRWTFVYRAGTHGVAEGGAILVQVPPFWGWSAPQLSMPDFPGFVTVGTDAVGVELSSSIADRHLLAIRIAGGPLGEGEEVRVVYGAGPAGAVADRYAERGQRFWFSVDGDGDGVRKIVRDSPAVDVAAGPPARMILTLPTTVRPGGAARLTVAIVDRHGNAGCDVTGDVLFDRVPDGLEVPGRIVLTPNERGTKTVEVAVRREGIFRLRARGPGELAAETNPMVSDPQAPRVLWGDLQIHSNYSDGSGTADEIYRYAREVAALDVAALTDHDHWGMPFLDGDPAMWEEIRRQARGHHEPGRFVTLLGYEWTSWIHGHRHVLFPGDGGTIHSSIDPRYETPAQLWKALLPAGAMTIAHHTAGSPIATNWSIPPDPRVETVAEIVSVHGSSEAADSPRIVGGAIPGHFVRDALDRGYRLGFVGSGDGHDGHPGLSWIGAGTGGLAALFSEELTREGVFEALRERRTYATSGPRIFLSVTLNDAVMGSSLPARGEPATLQVRAVTPHSVDRVDLIRTGQVIESVDGRNARELSFSRKLGNLDRGEYVYVRLIQDDEGMAWSSPFFID